MLDRTLPRRFLRLEAQTDLSDRRGSRRGRIRVVRRILRTSRPPMGRAGGVAVQTYAPPVAHDGGCPWLYPDDLEVQVRDAATMPVWWR